MDSNQPYPSKYGIRVIPNAPGASGNRDFGLLDDGRAAISGNMRYPAQVTVDHSDRPDAFKLVWDKRRKPPVERIE